MKLQTRRESTTARLLDAGLQLFNRQGYHGTGIKEIVDLAGLPKGSFYTYFASKEDFAAQVVSTFIHRGQKRLKSFAQPQKGPVQVLVDFFSSSRDRLAASGYTTGCLIGNLTNEAGTSNPSIGPELRRGLGVMAQEFSQYLTEAQAMGQIRTDLSAETLSDLLVNSWEGALIRSKAEKSTRPLDQFLHEFINVLLKPGDRG